MMLKSRTRRNRTRCTDSKVIMALMALLFFFGTALLQTALSNIAGDPFPDNSMRRQDEEWQNYHSHLQTNDSQGLGEGSAKEKVVREFSFCVAILSEFPEVSKRAGLVVRLLKQLIFSLDIHPLQINVFCQGNECFNQLLPKLGNNTGLAVNSFHDIQNGINRTAPKRLIISENYRILLEVLFNKQKHKYCVILEDGMVLSPDALAYLNIGKSVMEKDQTIFAVSLHNDNAFPWCARNPDFFRRTEQFSGLGFITSGTIYHEFIRPNWKSDITWDVLLQKIASKNRMVTIQPEMGRVLHNTISIPNSNFSDTNITRSVRAYNKVPSVYTGSILRNGYHQLLNTYQWKYDQFIRDFVPPARVIRYIDDAGFVDKGVDLIIPHFNTSKEIGKALSGVKMVEKSVGGLVPGIYYGSLFLRVNDNLVLLLSKDSPFYSPFVKSKLQELPLEDKLAEAKAMMVASKPIIGREFTGAFYNLKTNYEMVKSGVGQSCYQVCQNRSKRCELAALWLLNKHCGIIQQLFPDCITCRNVQRQPGTIVKGQTCQIGSQFLLSCIKMQKSKDIQQLCACR